MTLSYCYDLELVCEKLQTFCSVMIKQKEIYPAAG